MNKDKITTYLGFIVAVLITAGVLKQEDASVLSQAIGIIGALIVAAWGYFTNKE